MKLEARRVEAFLVAPGSVRAVLCHGEDVGLIRDRAAQITRAAAGSVDDPFRVIELGADAARLLVAEMASLPLNGGRRVVRVREASDQLATAVAEALVGRGSGLLVLEAPGLTGKSKLRALFDKGADVVSIGCYAPDDAARSGQIRAMLADDRVSVDGEALRWLTGQLGADAAVTRREVEKLALYVGPGRAADLAAAQACVGDLAGLSLEDALFFATAGDLAGTDRSLGVARSEGVAAVGMVRAGLAHIQRLHRIRLLVAGGMAAAEAVREARPPVFFRREGQFQRALQLWSVSALDAASARLWEADRACKRTGAPADALARSVILGLAQRAAANSR